MGVELRVDPEALTELCTRLGQIRDAMTSADRQVSGFGAATGSARVAQALEDFVDGWRDGRERIDENLGVLADKARGALDTYLQQESELGRSMAVAP